MANERATRAERRSYANVLLVQRLLAVLQAVNKLPNITVKAISDECSIPASSVVRILETLCAEGFLVHMSRRGGYALASRICTLSAGFHGAPLVVEILKAYVDELTRFHLWPCAVATLDRDAMVVQYSSIPLSPLAHVRTTFHKRLSLLSRAHGLAYLSFCNRMERQHIVPMAVAAHNPDDRVITSGRCWHNLVGQTRRRGYALRATDVDTFTQTIAVPILLEPGRVIATLGMTFFRSAVRERQIADYASVLKITAAAAVERIREEIELRAFAVMESHASGSTQSSGGLEAALPGVRPGHAVHRALPPLHQTSGDAGDRRTQQDASRRSPRLLSASLSRSVASRRERHPN